MSATVSGVSVPAEGSPADEENGWPDWPLDGRAVAQLARYVNPAYVASWVPPDLHSPVERGTLPDLLTQRVSRLYRVLADRRIPYSSAPWNPAGYGPDGSPARQRIRTPGQTMQGPATCLDLALTFASLLAAADLRPLIAFRLRPAPHALVLVELGEGMANRVDGFDAWPKPDGFTERPGEPGVWDQSAGDQALLRLVRAAGSRWLPVDVVYATRADSRRVESDHSTFEFAAALNEDQDPPGSAWILVDVLRVQAHLAPESVPFEPPPDRSLPPIHSYLPVLGEFREFGSRKGTFDSLRRIVDRGEPATVVIQAPSGYGKSMLARRLAAGADNDCGWFLNATDAKELTRSLAQAERGERAPGSEQPVADDEGVDASDDRAFAAAALDRLHGAERPWVVVVDNCDSDPETPGLLGLLPRPHAAGQIVIVTTTNEQWLGQVSGASFHPIELAELRTSDLRELRIPARLADAVHGRPLVALALAALQDRGQAELPETTTLDGPALVWDLLRQAASGVVQVARLLSWLPPEPMPAAALSDLASASAAPPAVLADLGFATWSASAVSGPQAGPDSPSRDGLLLHRLFAAAVRQQTWRDEPGAAADAIARLLSTGTGRGIFIGAADATALERLERGEETGDNQGVIGDAERAAGYLPQRAGPDQPSAGPLWYGLGHIRERRGPVRSSGKPFTRAADLLDPADYPYELAESRLGVARVVFHDPRSADADLESARETARQAQQLLAARTDDPSRQLREQANAMAWLIERKLAGKEPDPVRREARLTDVRQNLWDSFAQRLRIARGLSDYEPIGPDSVPEPKDGLGPERAFFNLAGADIGLARLRHELAGQAARAEGRELTAGDALLVPAKQSLADAERVYEVVRDLRDKRYGGRAHPHLAACLHGLAIVAYYQATLLGEPGKIADAARFAGAALGQRLQIATSLSGEDAASPARDGDVRKSVDLSLKIMTVGVLDRYSDLASGSEAVAKVIREAVTEWAGGPGRSPVETQPPAPAALGFEHKVHLDLPAGILANPALNDSAPLVIRQALTQIGQLSRAAPNIEVIRVQTSGPASDGALASLDVDLALAVPVTESMGEALRWTVTQAIQAPEPAWSPWQVRFADPDRSGPEAGDPHGQEPGPFPGSEPDPPMEAVPPPPVPGPLEVRELPVPPMAPGWVAAPPRQPPPRYLSASYPDQVRLGRVFSLEVSVVVNPGSGRAEVYIGDLDVGPQGKRLKLTIYAPGITVHGDQEQFILVPYAGDSAPVMFELEATKVGVQSVRLRIWDEGTCLGELTADVTVEDRVVSGRSRTRSSEIETAAVPDEITLEVSHEVSHGEDRYVFRFQDPETAPAPERLLLRNSPRSEVERLIARMHELAEGGGPDTFRDLRLEGARLWREMVPDAVHQQFWESRHRIGQLTILTDDDAFPWELLYPWDGANDEGFLATQFPMTRRIHGFRRRLTLDGRPARFVLPDDAPPGARDEVSELRRLLGGHDPDVSTLTDLRSLIDNGGFGVLHFACHGSFSRTGEGPRILLDRDFLPVELEAAPANWGAPLVFLNACNSANPRYSCIGVDSFADAFIRAGVGAFIGSLWEVRDRTAPEFAVRLYRMLREGRTLGEAVTGLRANVKDGDPTWLSYAVYGHPLATLG